MDLSARISSITDTVSPAEAVLVLAALTARYAAAACVAVPAPVVVEPAHTPTFYTTDEARTILRCSKKVLYGLTKGCKFRKKVGKELRFETRGFDLWAVARLN